MEKHRVTTGPGSAALLVCALVLVVSAPAQAYVGPGAGLSLLSALWGLLMAVGAALGFIVLWPIRRWRRRRRAAAEGQADAAEADAAATPSPAAKAAERTSERRVHGE